MRKGVISGTNFTNNKATNDAANSDGTGAVFLGSESYTTITNSNFEKIADLLKEQTTPEITIEEKIEFALCLENLFLNLIYCKENDGIYKELFKQKN